MAANLEDQLIDKVRALNLTEQVWIADPFGR